MNQLSTEKRLENIEKKLDNIESALIGDAYGNNGYGHRISRLEKTLKSVDIKVWMATGALCALTFIINLIFAI